MLTYKEGYDWAFWLSCCARLTAELNFASASLMILRIQALALQSNPRHTGAPTVNLNCFQGEAVKVE
jgi:hypothetical protein